MTGVGGADDNVWLPNGAPRELRDFLDGDASSVEIDTTAIRWLPPPIDAPVLAEPSVTIRAGSTPTTVTIEVAWSRAGPTSVLQVLIVEGRLRVSSSELAPSAARRVSAWVAAFNRELSMSDRQLDSLRVQGPALIVTTRSPFPPPRASSMTPVPVALAGLLALRQPTTPVAPWRRTRAAKLLSATAIFLLICGGAAVVTATWFEDPGGESEPLPSTESTASTSVTTSMPSGPCATDPDSDVAACGPPPVPPTTWTTSTTSTTSTTLPSGPCATDPDADVAACGPPPVPPPRDDSSDDGVRCVEPDVPVDVDNDRVTDTCNRIYPVAVIPPTAGLPTQGEAVPPRPIPATGSDSNVALQLGVLLILAGLIAMVAGHRRAGDENS